MEVNWLDLSIIALVGFSTILSFFRGFCREILSLIAWFLAVVLAFRMSSIAGSVFTFIETEIIRKAIGGAAVFFGVIVATSFLNFFILKILKLANIGFIDKLLGACLGATKALILVGFIVTGLVSTPAVEQPWWKSSILVPKVQVASTSMAPAVINSISLVSQFLPQELLDGLNDQLSFKV